MIETLSTLDRPPGSPGERRAAELLAERLAVQGAAVTVECEWVHGTYWVPLGIGSSLGAAAGLLPRLPAVALAATAAASIADDLEIGARPLRRVLRQRTISNVVAEFAPASADRTLVVHAHHDAAHTGIVFHPGGAKLATRIGGRLMDRLGTQPVPLAGAVLGPAAVALGALTGRRRVRALGALSAAGHAAAMADIAHSPAVPGANDNLSGVSVLVSLADRIAARPTERLRVILLSTGSEESFLEAMVRFGERHFARLDRATTTFLCLESVGSPELMLLDGEGLLRLHRYPKALIDRLTRLAVERGIPLRDPFRYRLATDGQVPLRAGYPTAVITSMDWYHAPSNYHWPTDRPENLDRQTVARAAELAEALLRDLDAAPASHPAAAA